MSVVYVCIVAVVGREGSEFVSGSYASEDVDVGN